MKIQYGIPYMGSKNKIAEWVVSCLPPAEHFYDLFCGGCAVTHAAIAAHRYKSYHVNDITDMGLLFRDIVTGKRKVTWEWVSREDFYARKDTDPLVRTIWSFGNDNSTYLYGKEVEPVKKALHEAIVNRDYTHTDALGLDLRPLDSVDGVYSRYLAYRRLLANITPPETSSYNTCRANTEYGENYAACKFVEHIPRTYRAMAEITPPLLEATQGDYQEVEIQPNSTVFCDIPYFKTHKYTKGAFDHARFYEWAQTRDYPVFVTEYYMPDGFSPIAIKGRRGLMSANGKDGLKAEKCFVQSRYADQYKRDLFC